MKKNRTTLKERFKKGAIPTEADFSDLIDSMLNQAEDNISKPASDALKVTATGVDEALLNFYRVEANAEQLSWQIKQKLNGKAGLNISDTTASRLFIENTSGNIGLGTTAPGARLSVVAAGASDWTGAVKSATLLTSAGTLGNTAGNELPLATLGFTSNNFTGLGVRAYRVTNGSGWNSTAIGLGMDVDSTVRAGASLWLHNNSNIGMGTVGPVAKLDIQVEPRTGTHPTAAKGLYITASFGADSDGVEFRHSNGTQGLGIGHNTIYTNGSNPDQNLGLKPRGTGKVVVTGALQVTAGLQVTGAAQVTGALQVTGAPLQIEGAQKLLFSDSDTSNNLKLQLWSGYGMGINNATLFYAADGQHSWRDASGVNERMVLTTAAGGGLTVKGTGTSSIAGTLMIGSLQFKSFTNADVDEWPNVTWYRDTTNNWDEGLIKASSARGKFGKAGFGFHMHETRQFNLFSTGWNSLLAVEGGTGNTFIKGYVAARQVHFSAYLDLNSRFGAQNPLPMQVISQNVGNAFDVNTSKFTAPVKGVYLFAMTGQRVEGTGTLVWNLMVNGAYANPGTTNTTESNERAMLIWQTINLHSSRTIILPLNSGDAVWIQQSGNGRCDNYSSGLEGVLISATI
jgi:hypothetical protein